MAGPVQGATVPQQFNLPLRVAQLSGKSDPTVSPTQAAVGSTYQQTNGNTYQKFGTLATDWTPGFIAGAYRLFPDGDAVFGGVSMFGTERLRVIGPEDGPAARFENGWDSDNAIGTQFLLDQTGGFPGDSDVVRATLDRGDGGIDNFNTCFHGVVTGSALAQAGRVVEIFKAELDVAVAAGIIPHGFTTQVTNLPATSFTFRNSDETFTVNPSGQVSGTGATVGAPAFAGAGDPNTGVFFPAADEVGISAGGIERFRADGTGLGFFASTPVAQPAAYTVTNHTDDRTYDADTVAIAELADVVGSIISDLIDYGLLQGSVT